MNAEAEAVWNVVLEHNRLTQAGDAEGTAALLHESMVIAPPGGNERLDRAAYLASIVGFHEQGSIESYEEKEPIVDVVGDVAIVFFRYEGRWKVGEETHAETGTDHCVLARVDDAWKIAWRTLIPDPA